MKEGQLTSGISCGVSQFLDGDVNPRPQADILIFKSKQLLTELLPQSDRIADAIEFAIEAHDGKIRKVSGLPYVLHPFDTALILSTVTDDEDIIISGLIHDTVEDSPTIDGASVYTNRTIEKRFGTRVASLVDAVTAGKEENEIIPKNSEQGYWFWRNRKQRAMNKVVSHSKDAVLLKTADSLSNVCDFRRDLRESNRDVRSLFVPFGKAQESILARYTHTTIDLSIALRKTWSAEPNRLIIDLIKNQISLMHECMDPDYQEIYNDWIFDLTNELSELQIKENAHDHFES